MSNLEKINEFVSLLLDAPDHTMQAVRLRLSATDYELVLKRADVLKPFEAQWKEQGQFPFATAEKGYP